MDKLKKYIWNILISIDQLANTILLAGDPDETISSNIAKSKDHNKIAAFAAKILDKIDRNHTDKSREDDEGKDEVDF